MGMNYYLTHKTDYDKNLPSAYGYDGSKVQELDNGWVWQGHYYATKEELNKEYYQVLHIGKSSMGWHFLLAIYPEIGINTLEDWKRWFSSKENKILDEEDRTIPAEEILKIITDREAYNFSNFEKQEDFEAVMLQCQNNLRALLSDSLGEKAELFATYDELLAKNYACRGVKGLWAHDPNLDERIVSSGPNNTYDYIKDVIFS